MMIPMVVAEGVRLGTITTAYRRWDVPRVKVGGTQLTASGLVRFEDVTEVLALDALTEADAHAAGIASVDELRHRLADRSRPRSPRGARGGERVFRITLSYAGVDPRVELREKVPRGRDLEGLLREVEALDAGRRNGPWTRTILEWIESNPGRIAKDLAQEVEREVAPMKADIRRLKALGLTISLRVGYQLSPRGQAYLHALRRAASS